jgi:PAS domain S-box-containing protein
MIDNDNATPRGSREATCLQVQSAELEAANRDSGQGMKMAERALQVINKPKLIERVIGDSQHMLSHLIDFFPDPALVIDTRREVVAWNKAMEDMTGIKAQGILGKGNYEYALPIHGVRGPVLADLIFEPDTEIIGRYAFIHREEDTLVAETDQMLFINGRGLYLQAKASPIHDRDGNLVGAIESLHDITERKLAEELRESEERFRFLAENTGDVLYRLNYGSMRYDYLGPAIKQLTGYWADEINAFGFHKLVKKIELPGEEESSPEAIIQNRLSGKAERFQADYLITARSGELKWVRDHSSPWCDHSGKVIGSVGSLSDVTERKQTEDALRESEKRFRMLAEKAPLGISLMNSDLTFEYLNPMFTEILGYTADDLPGIWEWFEKSYPDPAFRAEAIAAWEQDLREYRETGKVKERTYSICCKDGRQKMVLIRSALMDDGKHLLTYQDTTDQRNLEVHLRKIHKMEAIGTLAGGIAHDFNNILAAVIGYTEMTLSKAGKGSTTERNLGQILKAANRARDLIKQILIFSHDGEKEHRPVHIRHIVKEALKLLRASIPRTIEIRQRVELTRDGVVLADPTQIHQVLMNLCANAAYAMREKGGCLEVSLTDVNPGTELLGRYDRLSDAPHIKLAVSDTGCGIEPAILERIFDPFFTTKGQGQGTGMGLAVVHGIVKSHGGVITVNSELGKGATFAIYLPRLEDEVAPQKAVPSVAPRGSGRILFVDDEETLAELGKQVLTELGYEVIAMTSSREALAVFRAQPGWFDLVFTDYTMPEMNGADLVQKILSLRPDIPVILCTGYSEIINAEKAREIGIRAFLMKPLSHLEVAQVVSTALRREGGG